MEVNEYDHTYSKSKPGHLESDSDASPNHEEEEEEGLGAWGSSRKDYYNADTIETEADALEEENEAKRIQQKHLKAMKEADFGFDEIDWLESGQTIDDSKISKDGVVTEILPQLEITDDLSTADNVILSKVDGNVSYPNYDLLRNPSKHQNSPKNDSSFVHTKQCQTSQWSNNWPMVLPIDYEVSAVPSVLNDKQGFPSLYT